MHAWPLLNRCATLHSTAAMLLSFSRRPLSTSPCSAQFAPELSAAEVKAGLQILDSNKDGQIQLSEFVEWWLKK